MPFTCILAPNAQLQCDTENFESMTIQLSAETIQRAAENLQPGLAKVIFRIGKEEFDQLLENPEMLKAFQQFQSAHIDYCFQKD